MSKSKLEPCEVVKRSLATKTIYHYVDRDAGIDIKSREVFKNGKKVIHYPFNRRTGRPKYRSITKITYEELPSQLPAGFLKAWNRGYGFTHDLAPLLYVLQNAFPDLAHVIVSKTSKSQLVNKAEVVLNLADLEKARPRIAEQNARQREETRVLSANILAEVFPKKFKKTVAKFSKGQLSSFVKGHSLKPGLLSTSDIQSIADLMSMVPPEHTFVTQGKLLATKESLDRVFMEDLILRYEKMLLQKTATTTLEQRWQTFFRENMLYFNFGYVELFEKERIQGDASMNIPDFMLLNTYQYLDVFEIKTHLTQLLALDSGRSNFYWASEAARAISQAQNYIDSIVGQEDRVIKNIRNEYGIDVDAVRPFVYVIASSKPHIAGAKTASYKGKQKRKLWNDFRRLNDSLKGTRFVLYDELLGIFKNILQRLKTATRGSQGS